MIKTLITLLVLLSFNVKAGIIDTDVDSFIDTNSGLEWMDFGVNIGTPIELVLEAYPEWRMPTYQEVYDLVDTVFVPDSTLIRVTQTRIDYGAVNKNGYDNYFIAMGIDLGTRNFLAESSFYENGIEHYVEVVSNSYWGGDHFYLNNSKYSSRTVLGTMLVKSAVDVPEPSTIVLMLLAFFGLMVLRTNHKHP